MYNCRLLDKLSESTFNNTKFLRYINLITKQVIAEAKHLMCINIQ